MISSRLSLLALVFLGAACRATGEHGASEAEPAPAGPAVVLNAVEAEEGPAARPAAAEQFPTAALPSEYTGATRGHLEKMEASLDDLVVVPSKP